ncbi:hypothetical protein ONE56_15050 [Vibrio mytili]|uniref:hypothetical protein n=1 Tax=Vibrio mytili TaxID=50718 RepID=UPI003C6ED252
MPWIDLRRVLMLLVAMVLLPMQAFAALGEQKAHLPYFSKLQPLAAKSSSSTPVNFSEIEEEGTSSPISQGNIDIDPPALVNSLRWPFYFQNGLDDEHTDTDGNFTSPFYADAGYTYTLSHIGWLQSQRTFHHFTNDHRISGWKETNAMYVALNSQFSA